MVRELRDTLRQAHPAIRRKAASRGFLLVDMEFGDATWWRTALRPSHTRDRRRRLGGLPARSGVPLARATLMMAWNAVRADAETACILLGMHRKVAEVFLSMQLGHIEQIATREFRSVRPRWADRPRIWRSLLECAASEKATLLRDFDLHALQLIAGESLEIRQASRD
jgi:hypothetical protein